VKLWKRNGIYQYRFEVSGEEVYKSTGTKNKGEAEAIALSAYQDAKAKARGLYVPTLGELRAQWLQVQATEASPGHWRNVNDWDSHGLDNVKIDRLSTELVELARGRYRVKKGRTGDAMADETVAGWMRTLNLLIGWAIKRGVLSRKPYTVEMPRPQKKPKKILPLPKVKDWIEAVDRHARNPQVGTAVRLMVGLGLRESEALGARWEFIDWEAKTYTPGRLVGRRFKTKGGSAVPVDVPGWLMAHLGGLRGPMPRLGLILPWQKLNDEGREVEIPHPSTFTRASMRAANVDLGTPGVTPHRLRGTWITQLLRMGTPAKEVQAMARHAEESTTHSYYEVSSEVRKSAQEKLALEMGLA
jgi:integrase/recombinase XerC